MNKSALVWKNIGETPLECIERFRREQISKTTDIDGQKAWQKIPLTYAGRLDPMAEGELLVLIGDECKNKEKYLGLDKEYEVEILFGIETDTYDALGLATVTQVRPADSGAQAYPARYVGKYEQQYPPYSSKTFDGVQLHELARTHKLPEYMPKREVEIYTIQVVDRLHIKGSELLDQIIDKITLVKGDFRQDETINRWKEVLDNDIVKDTLFEVIKINVACSAGTYMRSLAHRMGQDNGCGAFALSIKRTKIVRR